MTTSSNQSILMLNDDCLYELFNYLPLQEACMFGITCNRINVIAKRIYRRFAKLDADQFIVIRYFITKERKMELIIKQIAQHVKSFHMSAVVRGENTLQRCETLIKLILIHCHNLTDLKLDFPIDDRFGEIICTFENFQNLESIEIIGDIPLESLRRLKHLQLRHFTPYNLMAVKNLESLSVNVGYQLGLDDVISQVCEYNPNIKRIEIIHINSSILNIVVEKLVHLEEFKLSSLLVRDRSFIVKISEIKALKSFWTAFNAPDLLSKLAKLDQLESLTYFTKPMPNEALLISQFTKLKFLHAADLNDDELNSLKSLRTLEHVDLKYSYNLTNEGIVNFVRGAVNLKYLNLCFCKGADEFLLERLSDLVKNSNRKLKVNCDFIEWSEVKAYPWLSISVESYDHSYKENLLKYYY